MGRKGSSDLIEFLIALIVGVLAILGGVLCIGFLLVAPVRNPPGHAVPITAPVNLEGCSPITISDRLRSGCTLNGEREIERQVCSQFPCSCGNDTAGSVCCCRALWESPIEDIECMEGIPIPTVNSVEYCGCTVCDDILTRLTLIVQHRDNQQPVAAARIYRKAGNGALQFIGITNNFGMFIHTEPVGSVNITFHIIEPNFIPATEFLTLQPNRPSMRMTVNLIPLMNMEVGLGDSPITIRLGTMASVSAPPSAFTTMGSNETYNDLVTFRGTVMTSSDENGFIGVPGNSFMGFDEETGEVQQYGVLLVAYLLFEGVEGETLTSRLLRLGVSVLNNDGTLPDLLLIYYDVDKGYWVNQGTFTPIEPFRKKRQALNPVFLQQDEVPLGVFQALAVNENADCWLQARTFAENGDPFPSAATPAGGQGNGPLVSLTQRSDIAGNRFEFQFGTDTGNVFNSGPLAGATSLEPNAICLPLRCDTFTVATLEAREGEPAGTPSLCPDPFPEGMFNMSSIAPLEIGTIFTWDELFFPSDITTPNPFYRDFDTCVANAQESAPDRGDYFSFQIQSVINVTQPDDTCFIKLQILDCFDSNLVSVTSINPDTALVDNRTFFDVERPQLDIIEPTASGTTTAMPTTPPTTCDENTATLRTACLPFVCGHFIQIFVRPSDMIGFCQVTGRSIIVNTETVSDINNNEQLIVRSNVLKADDYNDPNLGLYFDPGSGMMASMMAEERCNAGTGDGMSDVLDLEAGVAATFSCF